MKRSIPTLLLLAVLAMLPATAIAQEAVESYQIDPVHSMVVFRVEHLGVSYTYGRFNDISGSFRYDTENPANSSFEVTVKADSIDTGDEKRDSHLKSPDFFNVKQFPVITLKSKSVKKLADDRFKVTAELMLHGVTKPIELEIEEVGAGKDPWGGFRRGFHTEFTVSRSEFGMNYMPGGIGDEVTVFVTIEGIRK